MIGVILAATTLAAGPWYHEVTGWKPGQYLWKGLGTNIAETTTNWNGDWSGHDRISVDMVNDGDGGDRLSIFFRSPETKPENAVRFDTTTPDHSFKRWVLPLSAFEGKVAVTNVTSVRFSTRWGRTQKLHLSNLRLLRKGEASGGGTFRSAPVDRPDLQPLVDRVVVAGDKVRAARHAASLERFAASCTMAGTVMDGVLFGQASPMTRVMPRDAFDAHPATNLLVRLARNEHEALQVLVAPTIGDLKDVRVVVSDLICAHTTSAPPVFGASNIQVKVVGYCDMKVAPDYSRYESDPSNGLCRTWSTMRFGWYPEPLLDFLDVVDIRRGDVQSFWVDVRCPERQPAGVYRGKLSVVTPFSRRDFPFAVRVNDFTLPLTPPVPMNISFQPTTRSSETRADNLEGDYYANERAIAADVENSAHLARKQLRQWTDFLADHYITIDYLYPAVAPRWEELAHLKATGRLDHFNLKYWTDRSNTDDWFADARVRYDKAKTLGLLDHAVFYGMDELHKNRFAAGAKMIERLKREFPGVPLATTCKDTSYGCGSPLTGMDVFIPLTVSYSPTNAALARTKGQKVGWYVCGGGDVTAPNFFFARQLIESRLLMGAMAVKYRPDWFLYYATAIWDSTRPIAEGPYTTWSPESWRNWSGDGCLVACGPEGRPLSTLRLENFRDGLEDLHYAKILEAHGGKAVVPTSLVGSLAAYSDDAEVYQAWRDAMADEIEQRAGTGASPAAKTVLDFEEKREIALMPTYRTKQMTTCVTNLFASRGERSFCFRMSRWGEGMDQWPLFILRTGVRDWSAYDRLVIDLVNLDEGGDTLSLSVSGPGVGDFSGLSSATVLGPCEMRQWVVPLDKWPEKMSSTNVTKIGISVTRPNGCEVYVDNFTLLKPGEPLPTPAYSAASTTALAAKKAAYAKTRADRTAALRAKLARPGADGMLVGQAPTTEHCRPTETFDLVRADHLSVRLARNEHEGVQVIAVPDGRDLKGVRISVVPPTKRRKWHECLKKSVVIPSKDIKVYTVGYVQTKKSPTHYRIYDKDRPDTTIKCPIGWWPDPLLDFVPSTDVKAGTVQGFWISVYANETLPAGYYDGEIVLSAENAVSVKIPFTVRVNDFTLPKVPVMPTAISMHPPQCRGYDKASKVRREDPEDVCNIWKRHEDEWTDFAADHLITVSYLYSQVRPRFDQLMRLKAQGRLGMFNLGYWRHSDAEGVTGSEKWKKHWFPHFDEDFAKAKELGLLDHAYLYGEDEIPKKDFPKIAIAAKCFKERYPGVPLLTTCYDPDFGINGSPLGDIDWFTPLTDMYDLQKAEASRAAGHKVWWYISNLPLTHWANMFVEKEPIETRLLMGAMAHRMKVDGFLFYATCAWAKNTRPIVSGPYTSWDPVSYEDYHGCGSWMYCGPDGKPVPTIRLENYRDGLEDLAYVKLLKEKGIEVSVPDDVMKDMTHFTQKAAPLMAWRDQMADLIEGVRK